MPSTRRIFIDRLDTRVNEGARNSPETAQRRRVAGEKFFYPAAALYAMLVLPVSVFQMLGSATVFPGLASAGGHAHELLFGFALAVVAGNQLGAVAVNRLAVVAALWVASRAAFLLAPQSLIAAAANIGFAASLAAHMAPRLVKSIKKIRNRALPLALVAICASAIAYHLAGLARFVSAEHSILAIAVLFFALLLLFMGGRILAPAVAGEFYRQGGNLAARVQPRIESALIAAMLIASVAAAFPGVPLAVGLAAAAAAVAGLLAAVRMWRWRLWKVGGKSHLLCLAAGYAWLAVGLLLLGAALAAGRHQVTALHLVTIGGLGTLTLNVIAMTWALKARRDPSRTRLNVWGTVLIAGATLARVLADLGAYDYRLLLVVASLCWSGAFALLLVSLMRGRRALPSDPDGELDKARRQEPAGLKVPVPKRRRTFRNQCA